MKIMTKLGGIMEKLLLRLDIFKNAGMLSQENYEKVIKIIKYLEFKNINIDEDNGSMLITHIVMYLNRLNKGEMIENLDEESLEELKSFNEYHNAEKIYLNFENILGKINENEKGYILAHLINLLKGEKE